MILWRALQAAAEFVVGLALLCLLASLAVVVSALVCVGFIASTLLTEAAAMWGTLRGRIRSAR